MTGVSVNNGVPIPATLVYKLGSNEFLVGAVDDGYLKMDKIKVTGAKTYQWLATRYKKPFDAACADPAAHPKRTRSGR